MSQPATTMNTAAQPSPAFDAKTAAYCVPYAFEDEKHPHHGRTVSFHQPAAAPVEGPDGGIVMTHLFGRNRLHIATVPAAVALEQFAAPDPEQDASARQRAYEQLTPEERAAHDDAEAKKRKERRIAAQAALAAAEAAAESTP